MRQANSNFHRRGRGFTFVELVLGMVVTAMVMGAIAALMTAVAHGWIATESSQTECGLTTQANLRVQKIFRTARQLGTCQTGTIDGNSTNAAAVMVWKGDVNGDSQVQWSELAVVEHVPDAGDPSQGKLLYWDVEYPSSWTSAQKQAADQTMADDCMYGTTVISDFKNSANVTSNVIATRVKGAVFKVSDSSTTVRPAIEYQLKFHMADGGEPIVYGCTAMRPPSTRPSSQN